MSKVKLIEVIEIEKMNKAELIELINEYEELLCWLEERLGRGKKIKVGRKEELLSIFTEDKERLWSVKELAKEMSGRVNKEISSRNVSSLLSYLRADGVEFGRFGGGVGKLKML
jgi:transposase